MLKHTQNAFTMIELMITLAIVVIILSASVITLSNYIPRQRFLSSLDHFEQALSTAQHEATSRVLWTCVRRVGDELQVIIDQSNSRDCNHDDNFVIKTFPLSAGIGIAECSDPFEEEIWFSISGSPALCNGGVCTPRSFQIVISSAQLPSGNRAREIEISTSGLIQTIARGEMGYNPSVYAQTVTGDTASGDGACQ